MPVTIDGDVVNEITIDGEVVQEVTMDGDVVYSAITVLEEFDGFANNTLISETTAEWGFSAGRESLKYSDQNPIEGTGSGTPDTNSYSTIQSNPNSADVPDQTATFDEYPSAPATIRAGFTSNDSNSFGDLAFAVPSGEDSFNDNCYRFRGGEGQQPIIRRTVGGSSTALATFPTTLSANTTYDIAISFETTGSAVNLSLRIWEWTGSAWTEFESELTATDSGNNFPNEKGIGLATFAVAQDDLYWDRLRFSNTYRDNGEPDWTPN